MFPPPTSNTRKLLQSVVSLWKKWYFILPCARCCIKKVPVTVTSTYSDFCSSLLIYFSKCHVVENNHLKLFTRTVWHKQDTPCPDQGKFTQKTLLILLSVPPAPLPCFFSVPLCAPCPFISTSLGLGFPPRPSREAGLRSWPGLLPGPPKGPQLPPAHWNLVVLVSGMHQ